ncbi:hypothetical protein F5X99DRAFT_429343 [Biscogniauxia marginata]|nr:hypothetical protein F5X99DRAFT_429343 [Biscogniauxia marginata]
MTEHNGIDILCDAAGPDLLQSVFEGKSPGQQPVKRVKRARNASASGPSHVCHICTRVYERADHLTRHLRSHENARPYRCSRCPRRFNRAFVVLLINTIRTRSTTHDRDVGANGKPVIRRTERASEACSNCAVSKAKCDDQKPCGRCRSKNICCQTSTKRYSIHETSMDGPSTVSPSDDSSHQTGFSSEATRVTDHDDGSQLSLIGNGYEEAANGRIVETPYFNDPLAPHASIMEGTADDLVYFNPNYNHFQEMDFSFLDLNFDNFIIPQCESKATSPQSFTTSTSRPARLPRDPVRCHAAFKRSPWLWEPKSKDCAREGKEGLTFDEDKVARSPAYEKMVSSSSHRLKLETGARDRLFAMILAQNKDLVKVPSFPSAELLNYLLQTHFVHDEYQTDNWIHSASFNPSKVMPELLAAIISSGATFIAVPAIWQFGLALQEVVRMGIAEKLESSNLLTRDLQCQQAYILVLDVGLWSGFKRKMEIAESFVQPVVTMLRRAGKFSAPPDSPSLVPLLSDSTELLTMKWHKFIQRESFKRLVIHLLLHDYQSSVSFQKNTLISYTEICFSLPASRDLWKAPSAQAWRDIYIQKKPRSSDTDLPRLSDAMYCMNMLETLEEYVDVELCYTTILYGFWGQIAAYREAVKFYRHGATPANQRHATHCLWLTSQHQELYRDLGDFHTRLCTSPKALPHLIIVAELFMMILHVSPDELQRFAGKSGEDEARRAAFALEDEWLPSREARHAVWHAGQVFRNARLLPPASLRGFNAIAVYFASLTLWVYGLLSCSRSTQGHRHDHDHDHGDKLTTTTTTTTAYVLVDTREDRQTHAFLQLDRGVPGITRAGDPLSGVESLSNPGAVLNVARGIFRGSYPVRCEPLPPLVESLGNLLRDLGSGPASHASKLPSRAASEDRL